MTTRRSTVAVFSLCLCTLATTASAQPMPNPAPGAAAPAPAAPAAPAAVPKPAAPPPSAARAQTLAPAPAAPAAPAPAPKPAAPPPSAAPAPAPTPAAAPAPAPATPAAAPAPAPAPANAAAPAAPAPAPEAAPAPAPQAAPAPAAVTLSASTENAGASDDAGDDSNDDKPISLGVLIGAGFALDDTVGDINALGFGLGVRGGYTLNRDWYFGGRLLFYLGGSSDIATGRLAMSTWLLAGEAGYNFHFCDLIVRPDLALGIAVRDVSGPPAFSSPATGGFIAGAGDPSNAGLYIGPGVSAIVPLSMLFGDAADMFFVGGEARLHFVVSGNSYAGFELLAHAGVRL